MMYLVKGEIRGSYPLPPEQFLPLVARDLETAAQHEAQGKILAQGALAGGKGGYYIYDVDSNEELHTLISQMGLFPFCDWEIIPLVSNVKAQESVRRALESVRVSRA